MALSLSALVHLHPQGAWSVCGQWAVRGSWVGHWLVTVNDSGCSVGLLSLA